LDTTWYTLDNGLTNITFSGLAGTISQIEWDKQSEGPLIIRFYANDTFGRINYQDVVVIKQNPSVPPGIPGYNLLILIGMLSVISGLIIRKRQHR